MLVRSENLVSSKEVFSFYTRKHELAGTVSLEIEDNSLWLWNLVIFEEYRGRGLAKELLKDIELIAKNNNLSSMSLKVIDSNNVARKLCLKFGFRTFKRFSLCRAMKKEIANTEKLNFCPNCDIPMDETVAGDLCCPKCTYQYFPYIIKAIEKE